jgi:hypothetical protein
MQRTYKILLRAVSVVFLSAIVFSGNLGKLVHGDGEDGRQAQKGPSRIFGAFVPPTTLADAAQGDGSQTQYYDACGDSCDGGF